MDGFLASEGSTRTGIQRTATLANLWTKGSWNLPPARLDHQVMIQTFLSTIHLSDHEDTLEQFPNNWKSNRFSTREIYNTLRENSPEITWFNEIWVFSGIHWVAIQ